MGLPETFALSSDQFQGLRPVIATLRSIMFGICSIAAFTFTLAVTLSPFGAFWAFVTSLAAGICVTVGLTLRSMR